MPTQKWIAVTAVLTIALASLAGTAPAGAASESDVYAAAATLSGPITTGHISEPLSGVGTDLAANGYVEQEYFASGTAHAFDATSSPSDGRLAIAPTTSAPYETRFIVRRPASPEKFNGTVVVEWLNVTAGESSPDWDYLNPMLMNEGYAWVGVSAQALAVEGGSPLLGTKGAGAGLVHQEPSRYGSLHHPGDQYALDMYAQIGLALRKDHGADVLGSLHPHHIVAAGESQSAFYMTDFADALQPLTHAYDGIFIHSRGGSGAGIGSANGLKGDLRIRTDLSVPVFMFETQTDLTTLGYAPAQQPDTARDPDLGGGGHLARGRLSGRRQRRDSRLHPAHQRRATASGRPGRLSRLRQVGGRRDRAAHAVALRAGQHESRLLRHGQERQRDRRRAHTGRRRPHLHPERAGPAGSHRHLLPLRVGHAA